MPKLPALAYALRLLNYRLRSETELERKLTEKRYTPEEIQATLTQLRDFRLLDDTQLAKSLARDRLEISRRGRQAIFWELMKKGVSREIITEAIGAITDADELPIAEQLLQARLKQWTHLDGLTKKRRAITLLQRRGFAGKVINEVLKKAALSGGMDHLRFGS